MARARARLVALPDPHVTTALRKLAITLPNAISPHLKRAADRVQTLNDGQRQVAVLEALAESGANENAKEAS